MNTKGKIFSAAVGLLVLLVFYSCTNLPTDTASKLAEWRKGVWISGTATYTVYTDDHYFVISYEGDSTAANLYFGSSQIHYCNKGQVRKQNLRMRHFPGRDSFLYKELVFQDDHTELPMNVDTTLFTPDACNIIDGVIYDAVVEVTDEYILLATCNGDKEKIFANGVEFYSYRVERL